MNFNPIPRTFSVALILFVTVFTFTSCQKELEDLPNEKTVSTPAAASFVDYVIKSGQQYADKTETLLKLVKVTSMKFTVKFDNSAVYSTIDPANQADINKLYGFSDNDGHHHQFSARFGWRWYNNKLNLQAYIYNNGVRDYKDIGDIDLNKEYLCEIRVVGNQYQFFLNSVLKVTMPRNAVGTEGSGYQLFPYFGGDELAPHEIKIQIRDEK
jgi:hypothetical protein